MTQADDATTRYLTACEAARAKRLAGKISASEYQELLRQAREAYSAERRALAGER